MSKQNENVAELLRLVNQHPDLRIVPMVDSEIVADDCFSWWVGRFGKAEVDEIYSKDERLYIRSKDEDTLIEELCDAMEVDGNLTDEEVQVLAEVEVRTYNWERVITVKIDLP